MDTINVSSMSMALLKTAEHSYLLVLFFVRLSAEVPGHQAIAVQPGRRF